MAKNELTVTFKVQGLAEAMNAIMVWPYHEAPQELRDLSTHGGDEDWVALIPTTAKEKEPLWAEDGTAFGRCDVQRCRLEDGTIVLIGAHA